MINTLYIALFIILVAGIITLAVLLYREKFTPTPTLTKLPNPPIPVEQNLLLSDENGNLNIVKTDAYNSYLTTVNTDLTKWSGGVDSALNDNINALNSTVQNLTTQVNNLQTQYVKVGGNIKLHGKFPSGVVYTTQTKPFKIS